MLRCVHVLAFSAVTITVVGKMVCKQLHERHTHLCAGSAWHVYHVCFDRHVELVGASCIHPAGYRSLDLHCQTCILLQSCQATLALCCRTLTLVWPCLKLPTSLSIWRRHMLCDHMAKCLSPISVQTAVQLEQLLSGYSRLACIYSHDLSALALAAEPIQCAYPVWGAW